MKDSSVKLNEIVYFGRRNNQPLGENRTQSTRDVGTVIHE